MIELFRSGRLGRMCLKELRETLRDRRTLVTLFLMPFLVYPLLSMALQRLILSSGSKAAAESYLIGVESELELAKLGAILEVGERQRWSDAYRPLRVERSDGLPAGSGSAANPLPRWEVVVANDLAGFMDAGRIDLAVRVIGGDWLGAGAEWSEGDYESVRFDVQYRLGAAHSEAGVYAFQRLLQSINDQQSLFLRQRLGLPRQAVVELMATSTGHRPSLMSSVAAVIPLILLLMTITGAVYPAIDLTAGERERGTMEALIASPVPRLGLLLSKYVAVMTVANLTAMVNLIGMLMTLSVGGLGRAILGGEAIPWLAMLQILPLLILFSSFFAAVLLALCSVARSFKEAQAYLIPVMLLSLGPGILSLLPGVQLSENMAVVPLFNMILLSRDTLAGQARWLPTVIAVLSTSLYALAFLAMAARLFGRHAIAEQTAFSWRELYRPARERNRPPSVADLSIFLAFFFPIYFVATNTVGVDEHFSLERRLGIKAGLGIVLFLILPLVFAWWRGFDLRRTFRPSWGRRWWFALPGLVLLAASVWTLAHEIFVFSEWLGLASLREEQIEAAKATKEGLLRIPLVWIWLTMAIVPAIAEETFFRGLTLRSLQSSFRPVWAIALSGLLFGLFHVLSGSVLSIERFMPTAALGWLLGWLAWRTDSLFPGIVVHAGHNGLLFTIAYYEEPLRRAGWGIENQHHLPLSWMAFGFISTLVGILYVGWATSVPSDPSQKNHSPLAPDG